MGAAMACVQALNVSIPSGSGRGVPRSWKGFKDEACTGEWIYELLVPEITASDPPNPLEDILRVDRKRANTYQYYI